MGNVNPLNVNGRGTGSVGLPPLVFMFTIDQIAGLLNVDEGHVRTSYLYYNGRTPGVKKRHHMEAVNIAPLDQRADWRISAREFIHWLRRMGFKIHGLGYFT